MKQYGIIQQQVYEDMPYIPMMRTATMVETSKDFTGWVTEDNVLCCAGQLGFVGYRHHPPHHQARCR